MPLRSSLGSLLCLLCCSCTLEPRATVDRIALYQNVEIGLMNAGAPVGDQAPIVAGRDALVRIFVTPPDEALALTASATLYLDGDTFKASALLSQPSTGGDLATTINLRIPGAALEGNHSYRFTVEAGGESYAWPPRGDGQLQAKSTGGPLEVVLVPVVADGFAPDVSPQAVSGYREALLRYLPIADADVRVRAPYVYPRPICNVSNPLTVLATEILALRAADGAGANTYYYALVAPAANVGDFLDCANGLLGLSLLVTDPDDTYARGSVGAGIFEDGSDYDSVLTFVHELGHAMGLRHAPCGGAGGTDKKYPYASGTIGRWAWDAPTGELKHPQRHVDLMSYCDPSWISDYNYAKYFARIAHVNATADAAVEPQATDYEAIMIREYGPETQR